MDVDSTKEKFIVDVFDYVIVGAGPSAMGILRGLLEEEISKAADSSNGHSKQKPPSIAIVERGDGPPHDSATRFPERWFEAANPISNSSKSVRVYPSEIRGRAFGIPVGQGLGGSSNINACLCLPPLQQDLESWPDPFRSSLVLNANYLRNTMEGNKAILRTPLENTPNPFSLKNSILDFYTTVPTMAAMDKRTNRPVRRNYYDALVEPFLKEHPSLEENLHWFRGYEAERLLVNADASTRVIGIECTPAGCDGTSTYREIHASKRVILCTGAIETPALLLVSKLGDKEPLLGVGQRLADQALIPMAFIKSPSLWNNESPNGIAAVGHLNIERNGSGGTYQTIQVAITDSASNASIIPISVAMVLRFECKSKILILIREILFRCMTAAIRFAILYTPLGLLMRQLTMVTLIFLLDPKSSGSVTISPKKDPKPEIRGPKRRKDVTIEANPRYLKDPQDMKDLKKAWDALRSISSSSLGRLPSLVFSVIKLLRSENFWFEQYCDSVLCPYYHFSGTCAMIKITNDNPNWVVDSSLKVRGYDGLYVCDASIFPSMISNPPALTCAALGYTFARSILEDDESKY